MTPLAKRIVKKLIKKKLKKFRTKFIPIDSEHFSIWSLIKNENTNNINQIIITASGGPFLNKSINKIKNNIWRRNN